MAGAIARQALKLRRETWTRYGSHRCVQRYMQRYGLVRAGRTSDVPATIPALSPCHRNSVQLAKSGAAPLRCAGAARKSSTTARCHVCRPTRARRLPVNPRRSGAMVDNKRQRKQGQRRARADHTPGARTACVRSRLQYGQGTALRHAFIHASKYSTL